MHGHLRTAFTHASPRLCGEGLVVDGEGIHVGSLPVVEG